MKLSTNLLLGLSLVLPSALAHPFDLPFKLTQHELDTLERRASVIETTGAPGKIGTRLELRQMQTQQPNQFTLLILAMQQFQAAAQSDITGYYQVAGIHGVPRITWNGVGPCNGCSNANGYCPHDSVLFPAWHRAYMALFEQELVAVARKIANAWPVSGQATTRAQMKLAAQAIRLPYWDWAAIPPNNGNDLPNVITSSTITINTQTGQQTIANPLYSYHFTDTSDLVFSNFTSWPNTLRYPNVDNPNAVSNDPAAITAFNNIRPSLQDQLYSLFTTCSDYLYFSNDLSASQVANPPCHNSLEGIHDTVHTTSGGVPTNSVPIVGHMYYLPEAAFDPLFWFHHAMVDRVFAMWQTLHPTAYGASQTAPHTTWTINQGSTQGPTSPLEPFYQSGTTFWTTDTVQNWTVFHYTYPEFVDSDGSQSAIASYVNKLYGPSATATAGSSKRTAAPEPAKGAVYDTVLEERQIFHPPKGGVAANGSTYEYLATIKTPRYALPGSYYVFLFMGEPASEDPATWITDSNLVGPLGVLADPSMQGKDVLIEGSIPLTRALTNKLGSGVLSDLSEALVGPFLKNLLQWRILGPDGDEVDPTSLPGFLVTVFASTASNPSSITELPKYSALIPLPVATHGKPGGLIGSLLSDLA